MLCISRMLQSVSLPGRLLPPCSATAYFYFWELCHFSLQDGPRHIVPSAGLHICGVVH